MWDGVRDMDTSNNEKSLKKTRFTPNLLAYWPLNEGYGKAAADIVSEQNMYLSSENMWSIDNRNYAMRLDAGQRAQLCVGGRKSAAVFVAEEEPQRVLRIGGLAAVAPSKTQAGRNRELVGRIRRVDLLDMDGTFPVAPLVQCARIHVDTGRLIKETLRIHHK